MKWLKWGQGNSPGPREISPAVFEGELGKFIRSNQVFKNLAQARAMLALNRRQEADGEFDAALKIAEKLGVESAPSDPWPIILRAHILREAGLLDSALGDYEQALSNPKYILPEDQRDKVGSQAYEIKRIIGQNSTAPITTVYVCYVCGGLVNFATAKCPDCGHVPVGEQDLSLAMVGSSDFMGTHNLVHVSRAIRSNRKPSDAIGNLAEIASKNWQRLADKGIDKKLLDILEGGQRELLPDLKRVMACPMCGQELAGSEIDKCDHCGDVVKKSELEKALISVTKIKHAIETRIEVIDGFQYDRFIESVVYLWSYMLREQKLVTRIVARRVASVMKELKVLRFEHDGAFYDLSNTGKVETHLVASNLPKGEAATIAVYIGLELNELAVLMDRLGRG